MVKSLAAEPSRTVMLVDADASRARTLEHTLRAAGITVSSFAARLPALSALKSAAFDAVVLGQTADEPTPGELMREVVSHFPDVPVVALLATDATAEATSAVSAGATDFVRPGAEPTEILFTINKALTAGDTLAQSPPSSPQEPSSVTVASSVMQGVFDTTRRVAQGAATVMIRGESGVGKEVIARYLHAQSPRRDRPFVKVHCAALPEQILESELFGYEKGAFTGAVTRKPGRVELAEQGTLFLDEIGDISPLMQVKLLRILQDKEYERLGGTRTLKADVRFVVATHKNLERMIKRGEFREDLYYRLNVVRVDVPPLRERLEDVEPLVKGFVETLNREHNKQVSLAPGTLPLLTSQRWPGNVRQLRNFMERLIVLSEAPTISAADVQAHLAREVGALAAADVQSEVSVIELDAAVKQAERRAISKALKRAGGDRTVAARILGVSRRTLYYKLREYELGAD
jgi:DNA-binding NtrC family response regulator